MMKQKIQQTYLDQWYILPDSNILYYAKAIDKPMIAFRPMHPNSQS